MPKKKKKEEDKIQWMAPVLSTDYKTRTPEQEARLEKRQQALGTPKSQAPKRRASTQVTRPEKRKRPIGETEETVLQAARMGTPENAAKQDKSKISAKMSTKQDASPYRPKMKTSGAEDCVEKAASLDHNTSTAKATEYVKLLETSLTDACNALINERKFSQLGVSARERVIRSAVLPLEVLSMAIYDSILETYNNIRVKENGILRGSYDVYENMGLASDALSANMLQHLLDIHRLSNSAYPGASRECAGLVMKMVVCSYTLGGLRFAASSHRPSDHLADLELQRLALGHRADSETFGYANTASARSAPSEAVFDWRCQLMELRRMQKEVANLGVRVWFPRTMALYEKWEAEEMQAGQYGQWNNNM